MENPPGILNNTGWISLKMRAAFRFRKSFPFLYLLFSEYIIFMFFDIFAINRDLCDPDSTGLHQV